MAVKTLLWQVWECSFDSVFWVFWFFLFLAKWKVPSSQIDLRTWNETKRALFSHDLYTLYKHNLQVDQTRQLVKFHSSLNFEWITNRQFTLWANDDLRKDMWSIILPLHNSAVTYPHYLFFFLCSFLL